MRPSKYLPVEHISDRDRDTLAGTWNSRNPSFLRCCTTAWIPPMWYLLWESLEDFKTVTPGVTDLVALPMIMFKTTAEFRDSETTFLTQPACYQLETRIYTNLSTHWWRKNTVCQRYFYEPLRNCHPNQQVSTPPGNNSLGPPLYSKILVYCHICENPWIFTGELQSFTILLGWRVACWRGSLFPNLQFHWTKPTFRFENRCFASDGLTPAGLFWRVVIFINVRFFFPD